MASVPDLIGFGARPGGGSQHADRKSGSQHADRKVVTKVVTVVFIGEKPTTNKCRIFSGLIWLLR